MYSKQSVRHEWSIGRGLTFDEGLQLQALLAVLQSMRLEQLTSLAEFSTYPAP
jgi:hypothetical protein